QELIDDFSSRRQMLSLPLANIPEVAEMMVLLVFNQGIAALEMNSAERQGLVKKLNIELRMVLVGSNALYLEEQKSKG
ncbi:MAG: DNA-binding transcriptional regulator FabR, partial [Bermanella sp.]